MRQLRKLLTVNLADISSLQLDSAITNVVIDAFLRIVERRSLYSVLSDVWAFETGFWKDWSKGRIEDTKYGTGRGKLFKKDMLLIPAQEENPAHWYLIVVKPKLHEIIAYDSLNLKRGLEINSVLNFLQEYCKITNVHFDKHCWKLIDLEECPEQPDSLSSGVYLCAFAEIIARNSKPKNKPLTSKCVRQVISQTIRRGRFDREDFSLLEPTITWSDSAYTGIPSDYENSPDDILLPYCKEPKETEGGDQKDCALARVFSSLM